MYLLSSTFSVISVIMKTEVICTLVLESVGNFLVYLHNLKKDIFMIAKIYFIDLFLPQTCRNDFVEFFFLSLSSPWSDAVNAECS